MLQLHLSDQQIHCLQPVATGPVRLDTAVHLRSDRIIHRTPHGPCVMPVRGPARESSMFYISNGTRTGPVLDPQGFRTAHFRTIRELTQSEFAKIPHGRRMSPYGARTVPTRAVHGLFAISKPIRARKLIMLALKPYGPRTWRQNSYRAAQGPYGPVSGRSIFVQNSP